MGTVILCFILFIPIYAILIWQIYKPKDAILWGKRWMYKEEPDVTETAITYTKIASVICIVFLTILFVILFISQL